MAYTRAFLCRLCGAHTHPPQRVVFRAHSNSLFRPLMQEQRRPPSAPLSLRILLFGRFSACFFCLGRRRAPRATGFAFLAAPFRAEKLLPRVAGVFSFVLTRAGSAVGEDKEKGRKEGARLPRGRNRKSAAPLWTEARSAAAGVVLLCSYGSPVFSVTPLRGGSSSKRWLPRFHFTRLTSLFASSSPVRAPCRGLPRKEARVRLSGLRAPSPPAPRFRVDDV